MKTKLFLTILLFTLKGLNINAQSPNWQWAKSAGGNEYDQANSVSVDASGNIYVVGIFDSPTITFGSITLTNSSNNYNDMFIVKYDVSGNVLWAKNHGGGSISFADANSITVDISGNIYMAGAFGGTTSITFDTTTLTNRGMFLVKYDSNGNVLWAKSADNDANGGSPRSVTTDLFGNVYVAGYFPWSVIVFDTITLINPPYNTMYYDEIFIVKYDGNGNVLWAKKAGGKSDDWGASVVVDPSGNIYLTGAFQSHIATFGNYTLISSTNNTSYFFLAKYDSNGNVLWAKKASETGTGSKLHRGKSVIADASGNTYVVGEFDCTSISFDSFTLTNTVPWGSKADMFIVKYNSSGNVLWAKSTGTDWWDDGATSIATDTFGNLYVAGYFGYPTITFGSGISLTNVNSSASNASDIFIVKYNANGKALWAKGAGGGSTDIADAIAVGASGNIYVAGYFYSNAIAFGSDTVNHAGGNAPDMFVAKLDTSAIFTGIKSTEILSENILIYPNPSNGKFQITVNNRQPIANNMKLEIYNVLGEKVYQATVNQQQETITLNVPNGVYFINLKTENSTITQKLIINK